MVCDTKIESQIERENWCRCLYEYGYNVSSNPICFCLSILISFASSAGIAAFLKVHFVYKTLSEDWLRKVFALAFYPALEISLTIIAAAIPVLRVFIRDAKMTIRSNWYGKASRTAWSSRKRQSTLASSEPSHVSPPKGRFPIRVRSKSVREFRNHHSDKLVADIETDSMIALASSSAPNGIKTGEAAHLGDAIQLKSNEKVLDDVDPHTEDSETSKKRARDIDNNELVVRVCEVDRDGNEHRVSVPGSMHENDDPDDSISELKQRRPSTPHEIV